MSKKNVAEDEVAKPIETEEQWSKISGDACEQDFLHVVELFSGWCGSSEAINSTYKRLAMDYKGRKLKFYKVRCASCGPAPPPPSHEELTLCMSCVFTCADGREAHTRV